jgi:hypothetical protein
MRWAMSALLPKADIIAGLSESPLSAKSGHMRRSKKGRGEEDKDDNLESP